MTQTICLMFIRSYNSESDETDSSGAEDDPIVFQVVCPTKTGPWPNGPQRTWTLLKSISLGSPFRDTKRLRVIFSHVECRRKGTHISARSLHNHYLL